jgi:phosphoribosylglycinamide formyltransferase-1
MHPFPIAVLISGTGTTLRNLLEKRRTGALDADIALVVSSTPSAPGLQFAREAGVPCSIVPSADFSDPRAFSERIFRACRASGARLVALGGFLKRLAIPADFVHRIINVHPALIPAFCGRGYYGLRVHQAVLDYACKVTGCTVHFVDDQYDHGPVIAQRCVPVLPHDTPESLAARVFEQECLLYPWVINQFAKGRISVDGRTVTIADAADLSRRGH